MERDKEEVATAEKTKKNEHIQKDGVRELQNTSTLQQFDGQ